MMTSSKGTIALAGALLALALLIGPAVADTMTREEATDRDGNDYFTVFAGNPGYNGSAESCGEYCLNQPGCNAATWVARDQSCWLKETVPAATTRTGVVSFLRVKSQPPAAPAATIAGKEAAGSTGGVAVTSSPSGASVYLDGEFRGVTPLNINDAAAGSHNLLVTLKGYDNNQQKITVTAGSVQPVSVEFGGKKTPGFEGLLAVFGCLSLLVIRRSFP